MGYKSQSVGVLAQPPLATCFLRNVGRVHRVTISGSIVDEDRMGRRRSNRLFSLLPRVPSIAATIFLPIWSEDDVFVA